MSVVFSGDEIIELAVKTEETGYEFYRMAQKKAGSDELKKLFEYLAEEELNHKELYLGLKGAIGEPAQGVPADWEDVGKYIRAMTESSLFLGADKNIQLASKAATDKDAVDFAIEFEKDTLLFFHHIKDLVKKVNQPVVEKIIEEEKEHIRRLSEVRHSVE